MKNDGNENKVNLPEKHDLRKGESGKGGGGGGGGRGGGMEWVGKRSLGTAT